MLVSRNEKAKNHGNIINYFNYHSFNISGRILSLCVFTCGVIGRRWNNCFKEWNLYTYCGGNPINYVDPSGHKLTPKQKAAKKIIKKISSWLDAKTKMI